MEKKIAKSIALLLLLGLSLYFGLDTLTNVDSFTCVAITLLVMLVFFCYMPAFENIRSAKYEVGTNSLITIIATITGIYVGLYANNVSQTEKDKDRCISVLTAAKMDIKKSYDDLKTNVFGILEKRKETDTVGTDIENQINLDVPYLMSDYLKQDFMLSQINPVLMYWFLGAVKKTISAYSVMFTNTPNIRHFKFKFEFVNIYTVTLLKFIDLEVEYIKSQKSDDELSIDVNKIMEDVNDQVKWVTEKYPDIATYESIKVP
jgi:hypothetical protein